jgi:hypothetical protein
MGLHKSAHIELQDASRGWREYAANQYHACMKVQSGQSQLLLKVISCSSELLQISHPSPYHCADKLSLTPTMPIFTLNDLKTKHSAKPAKQVGIVNLHDGEWVQLGRHSERTGTKKRKGTHQVRSSRSSLDRGLR